MINLQHRHDRTKTQFSEHISALSNYFDPIHRPASALRIFSEDWVKPSGGFDTHPHQDMEIISYILQGRIEHKDTLGSSYTLEAGDIQIMSAGTGIFHSEFNASSSEDLNYLQIWIKPDELGVTPSYRQKSFANAQGITLAISPDEQDASLKIHQQARLYKLRFEYSSSLAVTEFSASSERTYYLYAAKGVVEVNSTRLEAGDGAIITEESTLVFDSTLESEGVLIELP